MRPQPLPRTDAPQANNSRATANCSKSHSSERTKDCPAPDACSSLLVIVFSDLLLLLLYVRLGGFGRQRRNCLTYLGGVGLLHQARHPIHQHAGEPDATISTGSYSQGHITSRPISQLTWTSHPQRPKTRARHRSYNTSFDKRLRRLPDTGAPSARLLDRSKKEPRVSGAKSREELSQRDGSAIADSHARNGCRNATEMQQ
jgi:hypothetical protein